MKINLKTLAVVSLLATMSSAALAQNILSRSTHLNWSSTYGGGPTVFTPSAQTIKNDLVTSDTTNLSFNDSKAGDFPIGWTASVDINLTQSHSINGSFSNFQSISGAMTTTKTTSASGIGVAFISSTLPGNELIFEFSVANQMNYSLTGNLYYDLDGAFVNSIVSIQAFNGFFWADILGATTAPLGNSQNFNFTGTLGAGTYRMFSGQATNNGPSYNANNSFTLTNLDAVPEPGTMIALTALAIAAARRRKQK